MNVTLISLEALILKATNESLRYPDEAALEAFWVVMRESSEGTQLATQALAARMHSPNGREALLALIMLDRCMRKGDANFHAEIGKFRFLNEMIKLVSPKYLADRTAPEVRLRVLQLLYKWSMQYPKETKFKVAYDMLRNQGVVTQTPPALEEHDTFPNRGSRKFVSTFQDDETLVLLQKLLQSKRPEDLQSANCLIRTMVRDDECRVELNQRRNKEVSSALDSAQLLKELLANEDPSQEEEQLMSELYISCGAIRMELQRLKTEEYKEDCLDDIKQATAALDGVLVQYNAYTRIKKEKTSKKETPQTNASLLDFAGARDDVRPCASKGDVKPSVSRSDVISKEVIDELGDIFSAESNPRDNVEPLTPVVRYVKFDKQYQYEPEVWDDLDSLGDQLMQQALPDNTKRQSSFNRTPNNVPMNALTSPKHEAPTTSALLDLDFFTKKPAEDEVTSSKLASPNDDAIVDITNPQPSTSQSNDILNLETEEIATNAPVPTSPEKEREDDDKNEKKYEVKPLNDIYVTLSSVHPGTVPPMTIYEEDNGLTVVLHFCKDKPRQDVHVVVISTTNTSKFPVTDYRFQGMVPKGCKIRMLPASGSVLPEYNQFLPPAAITQIMLIGRPLSRPQVDLKFVLSYVCDDDTCSEICEVKDLPLDFV